MLRFVNIMQNIDSIMFKEKDNFSGHISLELSNS